MRKRGFLIMNGITWFLVMIIIAEHVPQMIDNLFQGFVAILGVGYMGWLSYRSLRIGCETAKK